jgi:hypothetical protein
VTAADVSSIDKMFPVWGSNVNVTGREVRKLGQAREWWSRRSFVFVDETSE